MIKMSVLTATKLETYKISVEPSTSRPGLMSVAIYDSGGEDEDCVCSFYCNEEDVLAEIESRGFIDVE